MRVVVNYPPFLLWIEWAVLSIHFNLRLPPSVSSWFAKVGLLKTTLPRLPCGQGPACKIGSVNETDSEDFGGRSKAEFLIVASGKLNPVNICWFLCMCICNNFPGPNHQFHECKRQGWRGQELPDMVYSWSRYWIPYSTDCVEITPSWWARPKFLSPAPISLRAPQTHTLFLSLSSPSPYGIQPFTQLFKSKHPGVISIPQSLSTHFQVLLNLYLIYTPYWPLLFNFTANILVQVTFTLVLNSAIRVLTGFLAAHLAS